jgi:predicted nucleic acid-binding protein
MATRGRRLDALVDTSVAIALLVEDHELRVATLSVVGARRIGLSGHALFETYSVLTRLPAPNRRSPEAVARLIREDFPVNWHPSPEAAGSLVNQLVAANISGGSVYDALVAAAALESGLSLLTCDRRALATYRALKVPCEVILR